MSNICQRKGNFPPPRISEYEAIFERVNRGLFEIYTYCLAEGIPWCKIRPGLWDASEEDIKVYLANKEKGMASKPLPVVLPIQSKAMPPMKAPPSKKDVPQKRPLPSLVDLELSEIASGPPSSDERAPARKALPPPPVMEIVSGPPSSDQRPPAKKVLPPPRVKPAPPIPKDPRVSSTPYRPEPSFPKQDASKASGGPKAPPFPPPGWRAGAGAPTSLEPKEPPPRTNRWNKIVSKPSTNKILTKPTFGNTEDQDEDMASVKAIQEDEDMASVKAIQDDEDMASVKAETSAKAEIPVKEEDDGMASNPQHEDISRFPMPAEEEIIKHDDAVNYVKNIVREFLYGSVEDAQEKNPAYKRNALTNFLLMTLVSSFLDTVREAGRQMYLQLEGNRNDYYDDKTWRQIDELTLRKWSAHGRSGWVWEYMESIGVENFSPDDPTDMGQWQDWLTQEQLISTMEWLFESCWRAWPKRWIEKESRMQLWDHVLVLWRYYRVVVTVHVKTTAGIQPDNFPSCWTWDGFLRTQRMKYVEKAVKAFRSKIGSAESLARMHAETFALDVRAFVLGDDD